MFFAFFLCHIAEGRATSQNHTDYYYKDGNFDLHYLPFQIVDDHYGIKTYEYPEIPKITDSINCKVHDLQGEYDEDEDKGERYSFYSRNREEEVDEESPP